MNRLGAFRSGAACALVAILTLGCATVALPSPTPSDAPTDAIPTAPPTPSPSPEPSPTPSPTPAPTASLNLSGEEAIAAFVHEFGEGEPPFHVETDIFGSGTVGPDDVRLQIFVGGDVVGDNFAGQVEVRGDTPTEVFFVDGIGYVREAGGEWLVVPDFVQTQPLNPFTLLDETDLAYIGTAEVDGQLLHQLQTEKWIGDKLEAPGLKNLALESTVFDIYVDDQGLPVWAQLLFTITGETRAGLDARLSYDAWYGFTNVGGDITIEPPV